MEEEVAEVLTRNSSLHVRDIQMSCLLVPVRAVYSMVHYTVLPRSSSIDVITTVDHIVMFCLITKRRINLVRLILDFMLVAINAKRRRHATLPYGMFLTRVFIRAQLSLDGHR